MRLEWSNSNTVQDLDEDEIKKTFFKKGQTSQAERVEDLEKEIDDAEANPTEAGALVRRDQAQDELVFRVGILMHPDDRITGWITCTWQRATSTSVR